MNRRINTEIGDSIRKDIKDDCNTSEYNFISSKRYLNQKTNPSESTIELKRQNTINPILCQQELVSIAQTKLYNMAKLSLQGQTQQLKNCIQQDLNLQKKSSYLNKNLDKLVHKIIDNQCIYYKVGQRLIKLKFDLINLIIQYFQKIEISLLREEVSCRNNLCQLNKVIGVSRIIICPLKKMRNFKRSFKCDRLSILKGNQNNSRDDFQDKINLSQKLDKD